MGSVSPRARRSDQRNALVAGTVVAVAVAVALVAVVVRFAAENPEQANLGSSVLRFDARRLAREIDARGPSLFKDPLTAGAGREVYIQHLGPDPKTGWRAIRAYATTAEGRRECLLRWDPAARRFVDPCTGATFPPDGRGLTTYPATVEGGTVTVDLRRPG